MREHLVAFAKTELDYAGLLDADSDYYGMLGRSIVAMIECFAAQGHSGESAQMALDAFEKLARFEPLTPLTGRADEWVEVSDGVYQNIRCSRVFKDADGAFDSEGRVFREPSGCFFTSIESRVPVTFPYTPSREIVDVKTENGSP